MLVTADDIPVPMLWQVCFCKRHRAHWVDHFLAPGFRHVFLLGYVVAADAWLLYDLRRDVTEIAIVSRERAARLLGMAFAEGTVLAFEALPPPKRRGAGAYRLGFWCSRAIAHVLGVRCVAATPKRLHDYLLKIGAQKLRGDTHVVGPG